MAGNTAYPSGFTTGINRVMPVNYLDVSLGEPSDPPATDVSDANSAVALAKGMLVAIGLPAGNGTEIPIDYGTYISPDITVGNPADPPATDSGTWSGISLLKGILAKAGL